MEFDNQYLIYQEYLELGGTLEEAPFAILELEARQNVNKYTFGRLKNLDKQTIEVKTCIYKLIGLLENYGDYNKKNAGISSESIDGYSVSYGDTGLSVSEAKNNEIKNVIRTYLAECKLEDGTPYLYAGGVGNDNKCYNNLL